MENLEKEKKIGKIRKSWSMTKKGYQKVWA